MSKISDNYNKAGLISIIGSSIVLLSYLFPANSPVIDTPYIWIWGLSYWKTEFYFSLKTIFSQISVVLSIIILGCVSVIIITSNKLRKGEPFKSSGAILITLAVSIIVVVIYWAIIAHVMLEYLVENRYTVEDGIEVTTRYTINFWDYNNPGFGLVGLIIGAIVILYGGIMEASSK